MRTFEGNLEGAPSSGSGGKSDVNKTEGSMGAKLCQDVYQDRSGKIFIVFVPPDLGKDNFIV